MTIQQQNNENQSMTYLLALNPVEFTVFIKRRQVADIPVGGEADWLREVYQEKDKRFENMLNNDLEKIMKNEKVQTLDVPKNSKSEFQRSNLNQNQIALVMLIFWCLTILPLTVTCWILFMRQSLPCLLIGIAFPILCHFLVSQIIR